MLNSKPKNFGHWLLFGIWCLVLGIFTNAYALNLDQMKVYFLSGNYAACINEGERILANPGYSQDTDQLYYLLALSYLKEGNYLRASDIFEIILKEFKNSSFQEEARLGLGDTYFLRSDYPQAERYYQELLRLNPQTKLKAAAYYRLSQIAFKQGDTAQAKEYLEKLKNNFSFSPEVKLNRDLLASDLYYTVQVGAFSNLVNAKSLTQKLIGQGYPAYTEESKSESKLTYRVRVGKFNLRREAEDLQIKLSRLGYPTKVFP